MAIVKRRKRKAPARSRVRKPAPRRAAPLRRFLRWFLRWPARIAFWAVMAVLALVILYRFIPVPGGFYMAREAIRLGGVERDWTGLDEISPHLVRSVMAAEDARFCEHWGFDFEAIARAIEEREEGRYRGASTITQQVAKNVFLWQGGRWVRKGLEAGFTVLIEFFWPKRRIMEVYLNVAEFGPGIFGAEAAAQHLFGRPASKLTLRQAALLAAVLPNPKARDAAHPSAYVQRRASAIGRGAQTLAATGRDGCVF